MHHTGQKGVTH